ncbi:MAG: MBL fold metallo-hydrolase [Bacillota bacterium]
MLEIEKYGIYKVTLPLPYRLNHVNCYAVRGRDGWDLVDSGMNDEPTRQAWLNFMEKMKIKVENIKGIYLTHYHPDHFGASGWLQQISGAPVYMSKIDALAAETYWIYGERTFKEVADMFTENGMPADMTEKILEEMIQQLSCVRPHPVIRYLTSGEDVQLGDHSYRVVLTPGHTDGHVCFFSPEGDILFSGDYLLPKITSNISLWPHLHSNPLKNFLHSLGNSHWLKECLVLPAHGDSYSSAAERVIQLEDHHQERLRLIKSVASRGATAYEVCRQVFSENLSLHEKRFAMSETIAHLVYLKDRGELQKLCKDGLIIYSGTRAWGHDIRTY